MERSQPYLLATSPAGDGTVRGTAEVVREQGEGGGERRMGELGAGSSEQPSEVGVAELYVS